MGIRGHVNLCEPGLKGAFALCDSASDWYELQSKDPTTLRISVCEYFFASQELRLCIGIAAQDRHLFRGKDTMQSINR